MLKSSQSRLKKEQVNFKSIKDQLQDIQNVAKTAEKSLALMNVKSSTSNLSTQNRNSSKLLHCAEELSSSKS